MAVYFFLAYFSLYTIAANVLQLTTNPFPNGELYIIITGMAAFVQYEIKQHISRSIFNQARELDEIKARILKLDLDLQARLRRQDF